MFRIIPRLTDPYLILILSVTYIHVSEERSAPAAHVDAWTGKDRMERWQTAAFKAPTIFPTYRNQVAKVAKKVDVLSC